MGSFVQLLLPVLYLSLTFQAERSATSIYGDHFFEIKRSKR